jgi:hypothetical protein
MEDISDRIETITQELKALHRELHWPKFHDADPGDQDRILNHLLNAGLGHDLKRAVDLLSQFLWCYIESAAARTNAEGVDYAQQSQSWDRSRRCSGFFTIQHVRCGSPWRLSSTPP